ncbi:MAG: DUF2157 domain-containing protein [Alphaproteobacteria bacterium]
MVTGQELDKLREDLDRWVAQGVISPARRDAILAEVTATPAKARGGSSVMPFILGMLIAAGATVILMGFSDPALIPRPLAVLILMTGVAAALILARWFAARNREVSSQVAVLAGLGLFGASLFFITEIYFIHVHPPDLVVVWAVASLAAAVALPSRGALAAGIITATVWSLMEVQDYRTVFHWEYLILWAVAAGWSVSLRWRTGLHLAAAGLIAWMANNLIPGSQLLGWGHLDVLGLLIIASTAVWVTGRYLEERPFPFPRTLEYYGLALALVSVFLLRFYVQYQVPYPIWQMFAGFSALTVFALALTTFPREREALVAVIGLLLTGVLYPNIAPLPALYGNLLVMQHGLFVILALWMVTHGVRMRDTVIVALGLGGLCAEVVEVYASATGARAGDDVLIGMGFILAVACIMAAVIIHRTIFKDGRKTAETTTGDSS